MGNIIPLAMAELKARGQVGLRAALIWHELSGLCSAGGTLRTEMGLPCTAAGLAQLLGYGPRAFANSLALLKAQKLLRQDSQGCYHLPTAKTVQTVPDCPGWTETVPQSVQTVQSVQKTVQSGQKVSAQDGQLLSLSPLPEQRKQKNRSYSHSPQAVYKRRWRARKNMSTSVQEPSEVSKSVQKVSALASIANINSLAAQQRGKNPAPLSPPTSTIIKHLEKLKIEPQALFRQQKPPPPQIAKRLNSLGIPHAYFSTLDQDYFTDGLDRILCDLQRKAKKPDYQQLFATQNHTICTYLRWLIRGAAGDRYGRKTVHLRFTSHDPAQLFPTANPSDPSADAPITDEQMAKYKANTPWEREARQRAEARQAAGA